MLITRERRGLATASLLGSLALLLAACEAPPMTSAQQGYRGTGMVQVDNPEDTAALVAANVMPAPIAPASADGPKSSEVYQNVQVLGDVPVPQFVRLMTAMTQWVSPEEGCNYCHIAENYASDDIYTKVVSRRMLQMTKHINAEWKPHVGDTGVTCYTCHRGQPVPEYLWFSGTDIREPRGMAGFRNGQNLASASVGATSLPYDPFSPYINGDDKIGIQSATALPTGLAGGMKATEQTYGLMMHFSKSLGVNCNYCHNSRAFTDWSQGNATRVTAWHGIQMARDLNVDYLDPLQPVYPPNRLGPHGDAPKVSCSTCHQGAAKPMYGAAMAKDYPNLISLLKREGASAEAIAAQLSKPDQ